MKKVLATIAAIGCLSAAATAMGGIPAGTGINGSLHDMTRVVPGSADEMGRVCVYCHTPHHAVVSNGANNLPLWNHNMTDDDQFTAYTWATPSNFNEGEFLITDPLQGPSRLCMSCHDGSIAIDQHGESFDQLGGTKMGDYGNTFDGKGRANLGKDLSSTHPIGFDYVAIAAFRNSKSSNGSATAGGATEIVPPEFGYATEVTEISSEQGKYNVVKRNGAGSKTIGDNLYGGTIMTCATCHEVHNKENATQDDYLSGKSYATGLTGTDVFGKTNLETQKAPNYFLYAKQTESLICLSCHIK
jgi:hypothetical protein